MGRWRVKGTPDYALWRVLEHQGRSLKWLAGRMRKPDGSSYTPDYVRLVKAGLKPASREFRKRASEALDIPEEVLFCLPEQQ